jgi:hypothetical protein
MEVHAEHPLCRGVPTNRLKKIAEEALGAATGKATAPVERGEVGEEMGKEREATWGSMGESRSVAESCQELPGNQMASETILRRISSRRA